MKEKEKIRTPKIMKEVSKVVKRCANYGDNPMAFVMNKDKQLKIMVFDGLSKEGTKLGLYYFSKSLEVKEIVFVSEAFYLKSEKKDLDKNLKCKISDNPERKECFIVCYFSKKNELVQFLPFHLEKDKIVWEKDEGVANNGESAFNPYLMSEKEVNQCIESQSKELFRKEGKKEEFDLPYGYKLNAYSKDKKAFFEILNSFGDVFSETNISEDTDEFREKIKSFVNQVNQHEGVK